MRNQLYKKVYIRSESDLPKIPGIYFVHLNHQRVSEIIYDLLGDSDKGWWLRNVDWYFMPVRQQSRRAELRKTLQSFAEKHNKQDLGWITFMEIDEYLNPKT